jgi:predicted O-methyltransferase YrrM
MIKKIPTKELMGILINNYMLNWKLSEKGIFGIHLEDKISIMPIFIMQLYKYARLPKISNVLDIGFNAGHTATTLLTANNKLNVVSFDMGTHNYIYISRKYINTTFGRHKVIIGDTKKTLITYYKTHNKTKFDLIIIDGGRDYYNVINDIKNCKSLAHRDTIIIITDTILLKKYQIITQRNIGPTQATNKMIETKQLVFVEHYKYNDITGITICKFIL